jgi:hypothetical protein
MRARRSTLGLTLMAGLAATLAAAVSGCGKPPDAASGPDTPLREAARLQRRVALLQRQVELAGNSKEFYLLLDPTTPELTLMLAGAELQRFPVMSIQVGLPRVMWSSAGPERPWRGVVWAKGELDPPRQTDRLVVQAAPAGKGGEEEKVVVPPTPEEMYPVPPRYHVRFADGLSIEIRPREADEQLGRFARFRAALSVKWNDAISAMRSRDRDAVRLRLVMKPKDADSLYRSLPPAVKLVVLDEGTGAPGSAVPAKPAAPPAHASAVPAAK